MESLRGSMIGSFKFFGGTMSWLFELIVEALGLHAERVSGARCEDML